MSPIDSAFCLLARESFIHKRNSGMEPKAVFLGRALPERYSQLTFVRPFGMAVGRGIEGFEVTAGDALGEYVGKALVT
jgi:hypothetical protein